MGRAHGVHGREKNLHRIWFKYLEERNCLENQGVSRMILKNGLSIYLMPFNTCDSE
jgi:hypothetical protein